MLPFRGIYLSRRREHRSGGDSIVSDTDSHPELEKPSLYQCTPTLMIPFGGFSLRQKFFGRDSYEFYGPKDHWWPTSSFPVINLDH